MLRFAVCTIDFRHKTGTKRRVNVRIGASLMERITSLLVRGPRHKFAWFLLWLLALERIISGHSSTAAISTAAAALFLFLAWARGEFIR